MYVCVCVCARVWIHLCLGVVESSSLTHTQYMYTDTTVCLNQIHAHIICMVMCFFQCLLQSASHNDRCDNNKSRWNTFTINSMTPTNNRILIKIEWNVIVLINPSSPKSVTERRHPATNSHTTQHISWSPFGSHVDLSILPALCSITYCCFPPVCSTQPIPITRSEDFQMFEFSVVSGFGYLRASGLRSSLITKLEVWSPASPVFMSKCPQARYWTKLLPMAVPLMCV